ncbi:MAG: hypothetical protein JSW07_07770 [bacterium]|nr:MAG: hypothetical protein JSW07_07770 [bacterium]
MRFVTIIFTIFIVVFTDTAFAFPDLMDIKHISSKGRVQDKKYNPDSPIVDELIRSGISSIPFLIERLKSKKAYDPGVLDLWPHVEERHVALIILTDFILDASWEKSTAPDMCFSSLLSVHKKYPNLAIWEIFRDHFGPNEWNSLIMKWSSFWEIYKGKIYWDSEDRFFRIKGKELKLCQ